MFLQASSAGAEFIANTGFTRANLQGCSVPGDATHICAGCWAKSLNAKSYWQSVVKPFQTFDTDAKKERASRIQLSDEVMVGQPADQAPLL